MSLPDVFNKFDFSVGEDDGYTFCEQKKFTSKFDDVYKIIDQENGDIVTIVYDFSILLGTTLYISYLTTKRNESGATYVISKRIVAYNTHYIPKNALIHDKCEVQAVYMVDGTFFMRRFNLNNETTYWLYWDAIDVEKFCNRIV